MNIIADENILFAEEILSRFGDVRLLHGCSITNADVKNADILIIRSVTRIDQELLDDSPVRFIGTATVGFDHVDVDYLKQQGIHFITAKGSNSHSVADWVIAALVEYAKRRETNLAGKTLGIIGRGNIGSLLQQKATALGLKILVNDPPLERSGIQDDWLPLDELLRESNFVTCHVPLTKTGPDKTYHLIAEPQLRMMKESAVLINSSRGVVVDNNALLHALQNHEIADVILDVYEGEPNPNYDLIAHTAIATPHIAGYSFDGKVNGTLMMAEALGRFLQVEANIERSEYLPSCPPVEMTSSDSSGDLVHRLIRQLYPIADDDEKLRGLIDYPADMRRQPYDAIRKNYPRRRDFNQHTLRAPGLDQAASEAVSLLGIQVTD